MSDGQESEGQGGGLDEDRVVEGEGSHQEVNKGQISHGGGAVTSKSRRTYYFSMVTACILKPSIV